MRIFIYIISFLILISNDYVFALEEIPTDIGITSIDVIKVIVYLFLILLLIYYFFWFIKKKNKFNRTSIFNSFGGFPLGQNKSVQVIEIGNKIYVLGVGEVITLINILDKDEDMKAIKSFIDTDDTKHNTLFGLKFYNKKSKDHKQFENELIEKFDQIKEKRIYSISNLFEEKEITNKKD